MNGAEDTTVPSSTSDTEVIPEGDAPVSVRVKLVKVTVFPPGLVNWICWTVTPAAPGTWVELMGGLEPWELWTVTSVGVVVNVKVEVSV